MAIAFTTRGSSGNTANVAVYSMAPSFLPPAGGKIVVVANGTGTVTGSISGAGGLTWDLITSINPQAAGHSLRMWDGDVGAAPSSVAINIDYTGDNATGCCMAAVQITGHSSGAIPVQTVGVSSIGNNPVVTFGQAVDPGNAAIVAIAMNGATGILTPPSGWTTIAGSYATPTTGLTLSYRTGASGTTFTFSTGAVSGMSYLAVEYPVTRNPTTLAAQAVSAPAITRSRGLVARAIAATQQMLAGVGWKTFGPSFDAARILWPITAAIRWGSTVAGAAGPQFIQRALASTLIGAPVITKQASFFRTISGTAIFTPFLGRMMPKALPAQTILTPTISKLLPKLLAATAILTAAMGRLTSRLLAAQTILTPFIGRLTGKIVAATAILTSAISRVSSVVQIFAQALAATMIGTASIGRLTSRLLAAKTIAAASINRLTSRLLSATTQATAAINRMLAFARTLGASTIGTPTLNAVSSVIVAIVSGLAHLPGTLALRWGSTARDGLLRLSLSATTILTPAVQRRWLSEVLGALARWPGHVAVRISSTTAAPITLFFKALNAQAIETAAVTKTSAFGRALSATAILAANIYKGVLFRVSASSVLTPALNKRLFKTLAAAAIETANFFKGIGKTVGAQTVGTAALSKLVGKIVRAATIAQAAITRTSSVAQLYLQALAAFMIADARIIKGATKSLAATIIGTAAISRMAAYARTLSAATIATARQSFFIGKIIAAITIAVGAIGRGVTSGTSQLYAQAVAATVLLTAAIRARPNVYRQLMAATEIMAASITTIKTFTMRMAAQAILTPAISRMIAFARALAAKAITAAVIVRGQFKLLAAGTIGKAVFVKALGIAVAARAILTPAIIKLIGFHMAAQAVLTASVVRAGVLFRAIAAQTILTAAIVRGRFKALAAATIATVTLTFNKAMSRLLAGTVLLTPSLTKLMSLYRTLAATVVLIPGIGRSIGTLGTSAALAWQRMTTFFKSHGLRRISSTTPPHEMTIERRAERMQSDQPKRGGMSIGRRIKRMSIKKRGDNETDVE